MREHDELGDLLHAINAAAGHALERHPELREAIGAFGRWLVRMAEMDTGVEASESDTMPTHVVASDPQVPIDESKPPVQPLHSVQLRIGGSDAQVFVRGTTEDAHAARAAITPPHVPRRVEEDRSVTIDTNRLPIQSTEQLMQQIAQRCRIKARGCRWAIKRRSLMLEGADFEREIKPTDKAIIAEAKQIPHCYVWVMDPHGPALPDNAALEVIAGNYDTLADAAELVLHCMKVRDDESEALPREAYELLAEAQSAVRLALAPHLGPKVDTDQNEVYHWLREELLDHQVKLSRHMRIDDPADPRAWRALAERIKLRTTEIEQFRTRASKHQQAFKRAQYHLKQINKEGDDQTQWHWKRVMECVALLVEGGIQPSSLTLRELLMPFMERLPDEIDVPEKVERVFREIDRYIASREANTPFDGIAEERSSEVREVTELLRNKVVVLIGGDERQHAKFALEEALQLEELRWIPVESHASVSDMEAAVARPETALVMLAIRWVSHNHEGVKSLCEKYGKLYVRLPGGYNPNQVAYQILTQVGDRLRSSQLTCA